MVKEISDQSEIPQDKKVVIDFYADWCGPCKRIAPLIAELATKYPDLVFLKVNVDEAEQLASSFDITALPTFLFMYKGNKYKQIEGADMNALVAYVDELNALSK